MATSATMWVVLEDFNKVDQYEFDKNGKLACPAEGCHERFKSIRDIKEHKKHSHDGVYCKVCDRTFDSWASAVSHKSQISGQDMFRKSQSAYEKDREQGHFYNTKEQLRAKYGDEIGLKYGELKFHQYFCKFCGLKHHTEKARQAHTTQYHPIDQKVACPGCDSTFPKGSGLIYHLEEGHCRAISSAEFKAYIQHKGLILRLLQDHTLLAKVKERDIHDFYEASRDDSTTGGVSLLDVDDENITWTEEIDIIEPTRPTVPATIPNEKKTFPHLAHRDGASADGTTELSNAMNLLSYGKQDKNKDDAEQAAWGVTDTSKALFPNAKPTPADDEWQKKQQARSKADKQSNILTVQWWNPSSPDYNPDRFYDPIIEKHRCPFPTCDLHFEISADCQYHIQTAHAIIKITCPSCLKRFSAHHALIAHVESSQKCKLRYSDRFGQALDEFSGGFLGVDNVAHPDLKHEKDGYTVAFQKYKSAVPPGWEERDAAKEGTVVGVDLKKEYCKVCGYEGTCISCRSRK